MVVFKARAGIKEIHFLPFNPTDKRTALTYLDGAGKMHRVSKGAPEQVKHKILLSLKQLIVVHPKLLSSFIVCFVDSPSGTQQIRN